MEALNICNLNQMLLKGNVGPWRKKAISEHLLEAGGINHEKQLIPG